MISATVAFIRQSAATSSAPWAWMAASNSLPAASRDSQRRQIHAIDGPALVGHCPLPTRRQFPDPGPSQLPF